MEICKNQLAPKIFGFFPETTKNLTTYKLQLDFCPWRQPPEWLLDVLKWADFASLLDLAGCSMDFARDLMEVKKWQILQAK